MKVIKQKLGNKDVKSLQIASSEESGGDDTIIHLIEGSDKSLLEHGKILKIFQTYSANKYHAFNNRG